MGPRLHRLRPLTLTLAFGVSIAALTPFSHVLSAGSENSALLFTSAPVYDPLAWVHGGERFSSGATVFFRDSHGARKLIPNFAASADPSVSFDGKRILFAGKQSAHEHWQLWEVPVTSSSNSTVPSGSPRRVTDCADDCIRPLYLPDERVAYARRANGRFVIEVADLAAATVGDKDKREKSSLQLTYGAGSFLPNDVLRDGRILFAATYPLGSDQTPELYTVYSDGSGVESYRCDHGNARYGGKQSASGDIVFTTGHGLGRFTSARAQEVAISAPDGEYAGDIEETQTGAWLLPWRANEKSAFQIMRWKEDQKLLPLVSETGRNVLQPVLMSDHTVPKRHPSALHDWNYANLLCLNAYTSKYSFAPGTIHSMRLHTRNSYGAERLLGSASVERDGSFFIQVPTEQPLQVELLDASGKTLKRQSGWFWMRRGEQRVCVGCHAGPETAPENAVPMVLLKSTTPTDLTGASQSDRSAASGGH